MFKNTDISIESSTYDGGQFLMIYRLMRAVKNVSINDENIETLREIYSKLRTIKGLDENNIADNLFGSEEIKNRICNNSVLKENGVTATFGTTKTSQINDQVSQIIENQKGKENVIEQ